MTRSAVTKYCVPDGTTCSMPLANFGSLHVEQMPDAELARKAVLNDLSGILIEGGWPKLVLPAIATEPMDYVVADGEIYHRPVGQLLQPDRDNTEALEEIKCEGGSRVFAAQYQQNPTPPDGNMIKAAWLGRYQRTPDRNKYRRVVLSCDPAGKAGTRNDYTAITISGVKDKELHLLHMARGHWTVLQ